MINVTITEKDQEQANRDRYEYPDATVQRRLNALYFKSLKFSHQNICKLADISYTTLENILKLYQEGGLEAVMHVTYNAPKSDLDKHQRTLKEHFQNNPPSSVQEACMVIKELTGIERSKPSVRRFLHRLGMGFRKTGTLPGKADPKAQEAFKKKA